MAVDIRRHHSPRHYLVSKVTKQSVKVGDRHVNLKALCEGELLNHSFVSRIISGERPCSYEYLKRIADGLGMAVDDLIEAIESRRSERKSKLRRIS